MDTIPQDVWPVIAQFMDDKTKRQMRLASTKWFNIIKYNNFTLYFTRKENIPAITERLSKYSWPIKLTLLKSKDDSPVLDLLEYLPRLTNLVEIRTDSMNVDIDDINRDQWMQLSTLTNLEVCGFSADYLPRDLWINFPKLTEWTVTEEELAPLLKQMTNLNTLYFYDSSKTWPFTLVPYPEKLTGLHMSIESDIEHGKEICSRLTNLKEFGYCYEGSGNSHTIMDITYATSLESAYFYRAVLPSLATNTNLTELRVGYKQWHAKNTEDIAKLTKLQFLQFEQMDELEEPIQFNFLPHLHQLTRFVFEGWTVGATEIINGLYDYLPRNLKALTVDPNLDLARLTQLTDLEELRVNYQTINSQHLHLFSNLTSLYVTQHNEAIHLGSIAKLTRLQDLTMDLVNDDDVPIYDAYECEFLSGLTNLTSLRLDPKFHDESFWINILPLTNIQILDISHVDDDNRLLLLTAFKHLTLLSIDNSPEEFTGVHFTTLTSLQSIRYRGDGSRLVHKRSDILQTMPYLLSFSCFIPLV